MLAIGVGGADAVDVMVDLPWETLQPQIIGVRLTGELNGWTAPKDVILKLAGILTTSGGTNRIIEYFGPGTRALACTGKATITNMGAELGATTSVFGYDDRMATYLRATERAELAQLADANQDLLRADAEVESDPAAFYEQVVEIDLSELEPHVVGPHRPDRARPVSELGAEVATEGFVEQISAALLGSCTNSSYEDITRAADVARQAAAAGLRASVPFLVTPGSEMVRATIERDGQLADLEAIGGSVLANACGPCIGQWRRDDIAPDAAGEALATNSIVTSFNRNFPRRNDGSPNTQAFIASPELTVAFALSGRLSFNPLTDSLDGNGLRLNPPQPAPDVPSDGFIGQRYGYLAPPADPEQVEVTIAADSERLERLTPFAPRPADQLQSMPVLLKAVGQCTTDAISPAGPWLRYRGHLPRISDNMFTGGQQCLRRRTRRGAQCAHRRHGGTARADRQALCGRRRLLGGRGRCELRRGQQPRACGHVAASPGRGRRCGAQLRAHPRIQSQEARGLAADIRRPRRLRPHSGGRPSEPGRHRPPRLRPAHHRAHRSRGRLT